MRTGWALAAATLWPALAVADGAALYAQHCAACHQTQGQGTVGLAPTLKGAHWARLGGDRGYLPAVLLHGLSGLIVIEGERHTGSMPGFGQVLDDAALAALANHVQEAIQGRTGAPYTEAELRSAREAGGSPPTSRERREESRSLRGTL